MKDFQPIEVQSILKPKMPKGDSIGWRVATWWTPNPDLLALGYPVQAWEHPFGFLVLSALEVADEPGHPEIGPEYHLSITKRGERCDSSDAAFVLHAFEMEDAKEDNHVPNGIARNFWRPVADHLSGYECKCVDKEPAIKEDKGDYIWRGVTE